MDMVEAVFCARASQAQVEDALSQVKAAGIKPKDVLFLTQRASLEWIACPDPQRNRSIKAGVLWGSFIGWMIGLAMLIYVPALIHSAGAFSIPAFTAFGWALFGLIVGSGGLLARPALPSSLLPHLEQAMDDGKILITLKVDTRRELDKVSASLSLTGATDMHEIETVAA
jgi:hypothetical protein